MTNVVLDSASSKEQLANMIKMQKGFEQMAGQVGFAERKMAALEGSIRSMPFVKAVTQINNWRKSMSMSLGVMSDWRNMSDEERETAKSKMSVLQKLLVPMMAYTAVGAASNKMMDKHNNLLTRITTKFMGLFAILGLIIFVFAAVSIAIDGANSPLVEMTDGMFILEDTVQGLILVFAGEDGEGGLAGAIDLATLALVAFVVTAAIFGVTFGAVATTLLLIIGTVNLVMNATDDVVLAGLAAIAVALTAVAIFLYFLGGVTAVAMAPFILFAAGFFALGALIWAIVTGKAPVWLAFGRE